MRDPDRIKQVLNLLEEVWHTQPDLRLTQLLQTVAMKANWEKDDLFYLEDDVIEQTLEKMLNEKTNS